LGKLLSRSNKALRDGIQLSEAITGDGADIFRARVLDGARRHRVKTHRLSILKRQNRAWLKTKNPNFERRWSGAKYRNCRFMMKVPETNVKAAVRG